MERSGARQGESCGGRDESKRGVITTYGYVQGLLTGVTYSGETNGHTTPDLAYTYDNFGRIDQVTRGGLLHADYDYDATNLQLTKELLNIDTPVSHILTRHYDNLLRPQSVSFAGGAHTYSYEYDTAGRLGTVYHQPTLDAQGQRTGGGKAFTYQYLAESGNLLETVTSPAHTVTNTWEPDRNILERKANNKTTDNRLLSRYTYQVNDIGQRTQTELYGWAFNADPNAGNISSSKQTHSYRYNQRGEVIERDYENSSANQVLQENYQFDAIGNRLSTTHRRDNVDTVGNYTANTQNQYTTVPGGIATSHDDDGNMLSGPVPGDSSIQNPDGSNSNVPVAATNLVWDAENRLVAIDVDGNTITYDYDYLSRRIRNDGLRNTEGENYFYDGWNLIAMSWGSDSSVSCYWTWGLDLSGSPQGAGGVGGLLATDHTGTDYYPLYDGNGNACQYIDDNGDFAARWEYDAFGRTTKSYSDQGALAHWFFHRFSTKHQDYDTGLYYYGYRYYDPVTGRWPSRDPLEEDGGINIYVMVKNIPNSLYDVFGLSDHKCLRKVQAESMLSKESTTPKKMLKRAGLWGFAANLLLGYYPFEKCINDAADSYNAEVAGIEAQFQKDWEAAEEAWAKVPEDPIAEGDFTAFADAMAKRNNAMENALDKLDTALKACFADLINPL